MTDGRRLEPDIDKAMSQSGGFNMLADQLMPLMDGTVFPSNGAEALNDPATYRQVPLIMGANKEEMKLFSYFTFDPAAAQEYQANMVAMSGFMIKNAVDNPLVWAQYPYLDIYRGIFRPENEKSYTALSDAMMAYSAQFASTGDPGTVDGIAWESWNGDGGSAERILFDANVTEALIGMGGKLARY